MRGYCSKCSKYTKNVQKHELNCAVLGFSIIEYCLWCKHKCKNVNGLKHHIPYCKSNPLRKVNPSINFRHTEEARKRISQAKLGNKFATGRSDRQSFYKDIRMDSRWEVATALWLDRNYFNWKYGELGYKLRDGRYYYPDFFIYDSNGSLVKLIEVKGFFRENNKIKFQMFKEDYPNLNIELWFKKELRERNIIDKSGYANLDIKGVQ